MKAIDGPWEIGHDGNGTPIVTFEARDICTVETYFGDGEQIAELIKNTPALYRLCKSMSSHFYSLTNPAQMPAIAKEAWKLTTEIEEALAKMEER